MGAAASSLGENTPISLDKAKELAGEKWSQELEDKFIKNWETNERLTIKDLKSLAPLLFIDPSEKCTLETIMGLTEAAGTKWNEALKGVFDANKTTETTDSGEEQDVIEFAKWKSLVPIVFETPEERDQRLSLEWTLTLQKRSEGNVVIHYEMYHEEFPIQNNSLTAASIDDVYGLTDVMPGCRIRLSLLSPQQRTLYENNHDGREAPWVKEDPEGTFQELLAGGSYHCLVIENPEQYKKDMEAMAKKLESADKDTEQKPRQEGCSCLFGNPCQDQYVCLDWDNRWAVAIKNGMTQAEVQRAGVM